MLEEETEQQEDFLELIDIKGKRIAGKNIILYKSIICN